MKYSVKWNETESFNPVLESQGCEREVVCDSLEEALAIFEEELEATSLKKVNELSFEPSEAEWRSCVTELSIYEVEDYDIKEVKTSEHYWIEL